MDPQTVRIMIIAEDNTIIRTEEQQYSDYLQMKIDHVAGQKRREKSKQSYEKSKPKLIEQRINKKTVEAEKLRLQLEQLKTV